MAKAGGGNSNGNGSIKIGGRLLGRAIVTILLGLFVWLTLTVHQLSIDMAVVQSQLDRIERYWTKE